MEGRRIGSRPFSSNVTSIDSCFELYHFLVFAVHYRDFEAERSRTQKNLEKTVTKDDETRAEIDYLPKARFDQ